MSKKEVVIDQEAILTLIKHTGFSPEDNIFELIDGAIDAKARHIHITYRDSEKFKGTKQVKVQDDGTGFLNPCVGIPERVGVFGVRKQNKPGEKTIGAFGFGTSQALASNTLSGGDSLVDSTDNYFRSAKCEMVFDSESNKFLVIGPDNNTHTPDRIPGSEISLNGLKSRMSVERLKRLISVLYYKSSVAYLGDSKGVEIYVNEERIEFHDPFLNREKPKDGVLERGIVEVMLPDYGKYEIRWIQIFQPWVDKNISKITGIPWESGRGTSLRSDTSGIYLLRNGRYSSIGSGYFGTDKHGNVRQKGHNLSGIRLEIENVEPVVGNEAVVESAQINKSNVSFKQLTDNPKMKPLWQAVTKLVTKRETYYKSLVEQSKYHGYPGSILVRNEEHELTQAVNNEITNRTSRLNLSNRVDNLYAKVNLVERDDMIPIKFRYNGEVSFGLGLHTIVFEVNQKSDFYLENTDNDIINQIVDYEFLLRDNENRLIKPEEVDSE